VARLNSGVEKITGNLFPMKAAFVTANRIVWFFRTSVGISQITLVLTFHIKKAGPSEKKHPQYMPYALRSAYKAFYSVGFLATPAF
jgi:hypothetical protein